MVAGTLEISWLSPMAHQYSCPATAFSRNPPTEGFRATEEEKTKSAHEILEAYAQEIFAVYKENGAKTSHSYSEVTFAGETYTCLDITASIFIVVKIRHRIFIRKQGEYAVAVSVMAGSDSKLERYVNCFEKLN